MHRSIAIWTILGPEKRARLLDQLLQRSEQALLYLAGTDFAVVSGDGRFQAVTGFVDAAPAAVAAQ